VIVRVKACALNYLDVWERRGIPGVDFSMPHISGADVAGVIEAAGPGVTHLAPGDKTLVCPGLSCMRCEACLGGKDNECRHYSVLGYFTDGGYAELVRIPAVNALPYPDNLGFHEAAAIPLVFMTAWHMLVGRCSIKSGDDVLIVGAGSGVGSAAIQIAKYSHARVLATAGSEEKLSKALTLGADHVIDHNRQSIRTEVKRITAKRGVDIAFEHVGAATWEDSLGSLTAGGRLVTCGATTGADVRLDLRHLFAKQISILGSYMGTKRELMEVLRLARAGTLRPVVAATLPLEEAAQAQIMMETRRHFGKIVLTV
jgi:NADPH:quinone reductase-like Zn-dependent oxidoreductase